MSKFAVKRITSDGGRVLQTTACFIDTNIFYDYPNLDQIKWLDVLSAEHVLIILPPVTFRELNDHKDSGRKPHLAGRAASTLVNIARFFENNPHVNPAPIRPGVELFGEYRDAPVLPPLNPLMGDDQLLSNMLLYRDEHPEHRLLLITKDIGMKLKAHGINITYQELPKEYETQPPQDPRDKKIKLLEETVEQLKQTPEPVLDITFVGGEREAVSEARWASALDIDGFKIMNRFAFIMEQQREEPPSGTMELYFQLSNLGTKAAENIVILINLPEGCSNWKPQNHRIGLAFTPHNEWRAIADIEYDYIGCSGSQIIHGFVRKIGPVHVTFPDPTRTYEFVWKAHAGNMRQPSTGVLRVIPKQVPPPLTPEEKAKQEEETQRFLSELFSKKKNTEDNA